MPKITQDSPQDLRITGTPSQREPMAHERCCLVVIRVA